MIKKKTQFLVKNGKKNQFLVKNGQKKSEYFLIRIFWIGRDPPSPLLTESKKNCFFMPPLRGANFSATWFTTAVFSVFLRLLLSFWHFYVPSVSTVGFSKAFHIKISKSVQNKHLWTPARWTWCSLQAAVASFQLRPTRMFALTIFFRFYIDESCGCIFWEHSFKWSE